MAKTTATFEQLNSNPTRLTNFRGKGLVLTIISLLVLLFALDTYPHIWFDEGYKASAGYTLATYGVYGSSTVNGFIPFDPGISSGPADLIALALSFKVLGIGIIQARLVSVVFTLVAILSLYQMAENMYGQRAGLFIILFMLAFPAIGDTGFLLIGRQILGEPAALGLIALGMWLWFISWQKGVWWSLLGGLAIGLGLLSKTQIAIALVPAMGLIGLARGLQNRSAMLRELLPVISTTGVIIAWMIIGRLLTPPEIAAENSRMLIEAIRTNLITNLWGSSLPRNSLIVIAIMGLGTLVSISRWVQTKRLPQSHVEWAESAIALYVILSTAWFGLLSIGWPRYAYVALVLALLLIGKLAWGILTRFFSHSKTAYSTAIATLVIALLITNLLPVLQADQFTDARETGQYIRDNISQSAVIETWEWELDALSEHPSMHHPEQDYLFLAIRQFSHEKRAFNLDYNFLEVNPDYVVTGPFSNWTGIYNQVYLDQHFVPVTSIGRYSIYRAAQSRLQADQHSVSESEYCYETVGLQDSMVVASGSETAWLSQERCANRDDG